MRGRYKTIPEREMEEILNSIGLKKDVDYVDENPVRNGFIIDFLIHSKFCIEVDGTPWHRDKKREVMRDSILKKKGFTILHFPAGYHLDNPEDVKDKINEVLKNEDNRN